VSPTRLLLSSRGRGSYSQPPDLVASGPYDPALVPADVVLTQVHCHTNQSDGSYSPAAVVADYLGAGYGALILTDHDKVTAQPSGIDIPISGNELSPTAHHVIAMDTTYTRGGTTDIQSILDGVAADGGVTQLAHPKWLRGHSYADMSTLTGWAGFEIHNAHCINGAGQNPVAYPGYAMDRWDQVLSGIRRDAWGFAVDDLHAINAYDTYDVGRIRTFPETLDAAGVMAAIASGNFVADVSNHGVTPGFPERTNAGVDLSCTGATRIEAYGPTGLLQAASGTSISHAFTGFAPYVRLVAVGAYTEGFGAALSDRWYAVSGTWTVGSGTLNLSASSAATKLILRRHREGDFTAQLDINLGSSSDASAALMVNVLNANYYYMVKIGYSVNSAYNNALAIGVTTSDTFTGAPLASATFPTFASTWYTVKMAYSAATGQFDIKAWDRDSGSEPPGWMATVRDTTIRHGMFGIRANRSCSFDNLYIDGFRTYYQPIAIDPA
jgi:hypothetical protein